jgi:acetoin utilization deacetylase AcuC-like enzyme
MGFCFINTIAISALYATQLGYRRIAVADFDTHSGNGTIVALKDDTRFLFTETYQAGFPGRPLLPNEHPCNIHRIEIEQGQHARTSWQTAWQDDLLPKIKAFQPEIILVSAGFDAHRNDPLGKTKLDDEDYVWITHELLTIQPHIVSVLEGGYSLDDTARCARLHVEGLASWPESQLI